MGNKNRKDANNLTDTNQHKPQEAGATLDSGIHAKTEYTDYSNKNEYNENRDSGKTTSNDEENSNYNKLTYKDKNVVSSTNESSQTNMLKNITNQPLLYRSSLACPITFIMEEDAKGGTEKVSMPRYPIIQEMHVNDIQNRAKYIPENVMVTLLHRMQDAIKDKSICFLASGYHGEPLMQKNWAQTKKQFLPYQKSKYNWKSKGKHPIPLDTAWIILPMLFRKHWSMVIRHRCWSETADGYCHRFYYIDSKEDYCNEEIIKKKLKSHLGFWNGYNTISTTWTIINSTQQGAIMVECGARLPGNIDTFLRFLTIVNYQTMQIKETIFMHFLDTDKYEESTRNWVYECITMGQLLPYQTRNVLEIALFWDRDLFSKHEDDDVEEHWIRKDHPTLSVCTLDKSYRAQGKHSCKRNWKTLTQCNGVNCNDGSVSVEYGRRSRDRKRKRRH